MMSKSRRAGPRPASRSKIRHVQAGCEDARHLRHDRSRWRRLRSVCTSTMFSMTGPMTSAIWRGREVSLGVDVRDRYGDDECADDRSTPMSGSAIHRGSRLCDAGDDGSRHAATSLCASRRTRLAP